MGKVKVVGRLGLINNGRTTCELNRLQQANYAKLLIMVEVMMQQSSRHNRRKKPRNFEKGGLKKVIVTKEQQKKFDLLQRRLGLTFENKKLFIQAFTHSSYVNEYRIFSFQDNERLEFLGDSVLELAVSQFLYTNFQSMSEGEMTKLRASIVCEPSLALFAEELSFGEVILLGKGEEMTGGRKRPALLADVFEAFIGVLYLDQGYETVYTFLSEIIYPKIKDHYFSHTMDFKSQLQEYVQRDNLGSIMYKIVNERGPAHEREFVSEVKINNERYGTGVGRSKKEAEQDAAQQAFMALRKKDVPN